MSGLRDKLWFSLRNMVLGLGLIALTCATGCQVDVGGQTLPSAMYMKDDVQYFAPGSEFILSKEAAALKTHNEQHAPPKR